MWSHKGIQNMCDVTEGIRYTEYVWYHKRYRKCVMSRRYTKICVMSQGIQNMCDVTKVYRICVMSKSYTGYVWCHKGIQNMCVVTNVYIKCDVTMYTENVWWQKVRENMSDVTKGIKKMFDSRLFFMIIYSYKPL